MHAEPTSKAPARRGADLVRDQRRGGRHQLVGGGGRDDDQIDVERIDAGARERSWRAACAACASSRSSGSAIRRERIPVRRKIHSSATPSLAPTSALETTFAGTLTPTDAIAAPPRPHDARTA